MKILILGGSGFIGTNAVNYFADRGHSIVATYLTRMPMCENRDNVTWVKADLTSRSDIERLFCEEFSAVIQAAARTSGSKDIVNTPFIHVTDNVIMNALLFEKIHLQNIKKVVFFSCTVMLQSNPVPQREDEFDPRHQLQEKYFGVGHTKLYIEKLAEFYSNIGNTQFIVFRHSNIYGPYDKFDLEKSHVFGATMTKVKKPFDNQVLVWGEGNEARDFLYVDDLLKAVELSIQREDLDRFNLFNLGSGKAVSIKELVKMMVEDLNPGLSITFDRSKPSIPISLCLDCTKVMESLGWVPEVSLRDGIKMTAEWYDQNF